MRTINYFKLIKRMTLYVFAGYGVFVMLSSSFHQWQMEYIRTEARTRLSNAYQYEKAQVMMANADLQRAYATAEANRIIFASIQPNQKYISKVIINHFAAPYEKGLDQ